MSHLMSPSQCLFCDEGANIQRIKFPCECLVYSHPDCYSEYSASMRERADGSWKLTCPECKRWFTLPDHIRLQINIPNDDDDLRPLTRKEARIESCKICAVLSLQGILVVGLAIACIWGYVHYIILV
jgi:hypothetical protein